MILVAIGDAEIKIFGPDPRPPLDNLVGQRSDARRCEPDAEKGYQSWQMKTALRVIQR
jgi:hypothetical protein